MNNYFSVIDSLKLTDTLEDGFRLLKAYHDNDTTYLQKAYAVAAQYLKEKDTNSDCPSYESIAPINSLGYETVFRFRYSRAFCDKSVILTLGRNSDSARVDVYVYESEKPGCKIINHLIKNLSPQEWGSFVNDVEFADFWGLKNNNGDYGFDGSNLTVTGYRRPFNASLEKYHIVYRWAAEETALGKAFKNVLDLSGVKVDCFRFR